MADNYIEFSEIIGNVTKKETAWIDKIPRAFEFEENEKYNADEWKDHFTEALKNQGIKLAPDDSGFEDFPRFEYEIDESGNWWIHADEQADLGHIVDVVQAFINKFRPDFVFRLTYAETCSRPRVGEFGGGWMVVSKDNHEYGHTWDASEQAAERVK